MAIEKITIEQFLKMAEDHPVIDVRSPAEYKHAHIPGAINLPLFSDEERKIVGTLYKQEGREKAIKAGLDFFGPKMKKMIEEVEAINKLQKSTVKRMSASNLETAGLPTANCLLIYCWRGGMRSAGVAWLLDLYGFKVYTLIGGYKKFRKYVLDSFEIPYRIRVLGGYTGSGKTGVLKRLKEKGGQIIDLEGIANHKGSAFGNIDMLLQPGQELFENLLSLELRALSPNQERSSKEIWVEDESQRIGLVNIPNGIWKNMRSSALYFIDIPFEERLRNIVREYGILDKDRLIEAIGRIREKLGGVNEKEAIRLLEEGEIIESFRILLKYYDRLYSKALHNREGLKALLYIIECPSVSPENADLLENQPLYQRPEAIQRFSSQSESH